MEEEKVMDYLEWSNDYERKYNLMPARKTATTIRRSHRHGHD